jgi:hypothetical protein
MSADAKRMQKALLEILALADSIKPGMDRGDIFFTVGKIMGTARFHGEWMKPAEAAPVCDDCEKPTDWKHAVQLDPWGAPTGEFYCEGCAERRWDRQQERLMEGA